MAAFFQQVLTEAEIVDLLQAPAIQAAKATLDAKATGSISFTIPLTPALRETLRERLSLDLAGVDVIPLRWIKGDTRPHVDTGAHTFTDTYLLYLTESPGEFIVDGTAYPITQGTGYRFHEGLPHATVGTGVAPRLLLGPMSEAGFAVGLPPGPDPSPSPPVSCCARPLRLSGLDYTTRNAVLAGNAMTANRPQTPMSHEDLLRLRKSKAFRR